MNGPLDVALVGAGLMGRRHLRAYAELERVRPGTLRLRAICDPNQAARTLAVSESSTLLGYEPAQFDSVERLLDSSIDCAAADVVTDNLSHAAVAIPLLERGLQVHLEKPLATTVEEGRRITAAAGDSVLAVGENNRRDPMVRLTRAVLDAGVIGEVGEVIQRQSTGYRQVIAAPWRHEWIQGGPLLDVGIHLAYTLEYLVGEIASVQAVSTQRHSMLEWYRDTGPSIEAAVEADDLYVGTLQFRTGALGSLSLNFGATQTTPWQRLLCGETGVINAGPDRSGRPLTVTLGDGVISGDEVLQLVPDFSLSDTEATLFGGERLGAYDLPREAVDRKLLAAELAEFVAVVNGLGSLEASGAQAERSLAAALSLLEAAYAGRSICVDDVISGRVNAFQQAKMSHIQTA